MSEPCSICGHPHPSFRFTYNKKPVCAGCAGAFAFVEEVFDDEGRPLTEKEPTNGR